MTSTTLVSILVGVAVQRLIVQTRAQRIPVGDRQAESFTGSAS
jgi:hypothetical protein